jgi:hypothetical protein
MADFRLLLSVALVCLFLTSACSAGPQMVNLLKPDDGDQQDVVIDDTLMMCGRMGDGRTGSWQQPVVRSNTWRRLAAGADAGDMAAYREIIQWMKKSQATSSSCRDEMIKRLEKGIAREEKHTKKAGPGQLPQPLGLKIGMTPSEADVLLVGMKSSLKVRSDDKPVAGKSLKGRASFPDGAMLETATLYFVGQRLWQIKLRPGRQIRKEIEPQLGKADAQKGDYKIWAFRKEFKGVICSDDSCRIFDMSQWLQAGVARSLAEQAYSGFTYGLEQTKKSSK